MRLTVDGNRAHGPVRQTGEIAGILDAGLDNMKNTYLISLVITY